jgi:hypothetical protein
MHSRLTRSCERPAVAGAPGRESKCRDNLRYFESDVGVRVAASSRCLGNVAPSSPDIFLNLNLSIAEI